MGAENDFLLTGKVAKRYFDFQDAEFEFHKLFNIASSDD